MITELWHLYLYQPLFNALIWLYNNWADQNLGWAVIYLTIGLRIALLPFSFLEEFGKAKNVDLTDEINRIDKEFGNDEVLKKEEIRRLLKKRRVQPWAKFVTLGVQGLVLILLYEVFISGIQGQRILQNLYLWIDYPGKLNTIFYGFELGERHTLLWPSIVAVMLFLEVYLESLQEKVSFRKSDLAYFILFPLAVLIALWWLPMVKSLFVLTSMVFSLIIEQILKVFIKPAKKT